MAEIDPADEVVLYCRSGARSGRVLEYMRGQGYDRLWNLKGGMLAIDPANPATMMHMVSQLPPGAKWAAFGIGRTEFPMLAQAALLGGGTRDVHARSCLLMGSVGALLRGALFHVENFPPVPKTH